MVNGNPVNAGLRHFAIYDLPFTIYELLLYVLQNPIRHEIKRDRRDRFFNLTILTW